MDSAVVEDAEDDVDVAVQEIVDFALQHVDFAGIVDVGSDVAVLQDVDVDVAVAGGIVGVVLREGIGVDVGFGCSFGRVRRGRVVVAVAGLRL